MMIRRELLAVLITRFPCCGGVARFHAVKGVPREIYTRTCRACGQRFEVERRETYPTPRRGPHPVRRGLHSVERIDVLEWNPE